MAREMKYDKKKYDELFEIMDDKHKIVLYLLSKGSMDLEAVCQLKISDVTENGIQDLELPKREQAALARYFKNSKKIESLEDAIFASRAKDQIFLTPNSLKISFKRFCKRADVTPEEVGVRFAAKKEASINESNVSMDMILNIIQDKITH